MSFIETCAKLAAYLVCIGIALELSHRAYWRAYNRVLKLEVSTFSRSVLSTLGACIPLGTAFAITMAFAVFLDAGSLATLGLKYDGQSLSYVAYGASIAFGCVTLMFLAGVLIGCIRVKTSPICKDCVAYLPMFFGGLTDYFTAAVFEEIITRGYIFYLMMKLGGPFAAIVGSAALFSVAHVLKHRQIPVMFTVNALIFGLITAMCRYYSDSLWLPIGLHFGWNVAAGPIFGLPYSGQPYDRGVVISEVAGPQWFTGGFYSLDAGVLGTIGLLVAAIGLTTITPFV